MIGPNLQFKMTAAKMRRILRALGFTATEIYRRQRAFKLRKRVWTMTVSALSTATTAGSQYTTPNGQVLTLQESAAVGATTLRMSCEAGQPNTAPSTLTYVANSSGTLGTHQASISYSAADGTLPADLGPVQKNQ